MNRSLVQGMTYGYVMVQIRVNTFLGHKASLKGTWDESGVIGIAGNLCQPSCP